MAGSGAQLYTEIIVYIYNLRLIISYSWSRIANSFTDGAGNTWHARQSCTGDSLGDTIASGDRCSMLSSTLIRVLFYKFRFLSYKSCL